MNLYTEILKSSIFDSWFINYCEPELRKDITIYNKNINIDTLKKDIIKTLIYNIRNNNLYLNDLNIKIPTEIVDIIVNYDYKEMRERLLGYEELEKSTKEIFLRKNKSSISEINIFFQIDAAPDIYWLKDKTYRHLAFIKNEYHYICIGRVNYTPPEEGECGGRSNYYEFIHFNDDDLDYLHNFGFEYLEI